MRRVGGGAQATAAAGTGSRAPSASWERWLEGALSRASVCGEDSHAARL